MVMPQFFRPALPITEKDRSWFESEITSWTRLHRIIKTLTERELLVVILLELRGGKRPEIIGRCLRRFNNKRVERELKELWSIVPKAGMRGRGRWLA